MRTVRNRSLNVRGAEPLRGRGRRRGVEADKLLPYNLGVFPAMQIAAGDSDPVTGAELGLVALGRVLVYYRAVDWDQVGGSWVDNLNHYLKPVFGDSRREYLDGLLVGSALQHYLNFMDSEDGMGAAAYFNLACWLPAVDSPEWDVLVAHLAAGRDVILNLPPLSFYRGGGPLAGNFPEGDAKIAELNAWLTAIGSSTVAYSLHHADFTSMIPRRPAGGFFPLGWPGKNLLRGVSDEVSELLAQAAAGEPGTSTIPDDYSAGAVSELAWKQHTYFRNPDVTTYLEPVALRQARFETQQTLPPVSDELSEFGLYRYQNYITGKTSLWGEATDTAAIAIRESLPGGGRLYILPNTNQNSFSFSYPHKYVAHWNQLAARKLSDNYRSFRRCFAQAAVVKTSSPVSVVSGLLGTAQVPAADESARVYVRSVPFTSTGLVLFLDRRQAGDRPVWMSGPVGLGAGKILPAADPGSLGPVALDAWTAGGSTATIAFETPDQGVDDPSTLAGPFFFAWPVGVISYTDQRPVTLERVGSSGNTYTPRRTLTTLEKAPWADNGIPVASTAEPAFVPLFAQTGPNAGAAAAFAQQIPKSVLQYRDLNAVGFRNFLTGEVQSIQYEPGIYASGKIYCPLKSQPWTAWEGSLLFRNSRFDTRTYSLASLKNVLDPSESFSFDDHELFSMLAVVRIDSLSWGVNQVAGGYYRLDGFGSSSASFSIHDFEFRYGSGF